MNKSKTRVLIAAHIGQPWGGISTLFESILQSSLKNTFELKFFESSIKQVKLSAGDMNLKGLIESLKSITSLALQLLEFNPQVVHIATAHRGSFLKHGAMVLISRLFRKKVILAPHCSISALIADNSSLMWKYWVKLVLRKTNCLLVLSKEWLAIQSYAPKLKIVYLPNAINTGDFSKITRPTREETDRVKTVFLGHITFEKGLLDLLKAASLLLQEGITNFTIDIVGQQVNPNEFKQISIMIEKNSLANYVHIFDPEFGSVKTGRLKDAEIFVLPSHHEGMPMSILEAMAAGLPIIASGVGGIPDLLENGVEGILVPSHSPIELAHALKILIKDPSLRLQMGLSGRKKVIQSYNMAAYTQQLSAIYTEMAQM